MPPGPRAAVRELTLEVPITEQPALTDSLKHVRVLQVLEFRSEGFVLLCRGTKEETRRFRDALGRRPGPRIGVMVLNRDRAGSEIIKVTGNWADTIDAGRGTRERTMSFFRAMEKMPIYSLGTKFENERLLVTIIAQDDLIRTLLSGLGEIGAKFRVVRLGRPTGRGPSALEALTARQRRIISLAHAMGYYEIPRRTSTEAIARILGMDKGTLGEHLRRAERNVFDSLLL